MRKRILLRSFFKKKMKIFVNYRREDEANMAFAIANSLMKEFGVGNVFFDRQAIQAGSVFPKEIDKALEKCRIFIPLIGREWLSIMKKRQALAEKDYVLEEIAQALNRGVFVLPVLVDDTSMPSEKDLPREVSKLSFINAVSVSSDPKRLPLDIKILIAELKEAFSKRPEESRKPVSKLILGLFGIIVIGLGILGYLWISKIQKQPGKAAGAGTGTEGRIQQDKMRDIDGNIYKTVTIGGQVWMAENLRVTRYRNGDPIPRVTDDAEWVNLETGAYCSYDHVAADSKVFGYLYNGFAVDDDRSVCPAGWHVPSRDEWKILIDSLGGGIGVVIAGGKLKESGYDHWQVPNEGADNSAGFTALPGGLRSGSDGKFRDKGRNGSFWSSTAFGATGEIWKLFLTYSDSNALLLRNKKNYGICIRCIKD